MPAVSFALRYTPTDGLVPGGGWPGATASGDAAPKLPNANLTVRTDAAPLTWMPNWRAKLATGQATAGEALKAQGLVN